MQKLLGCVETGTGRDHGEGSVARADAGGEIMLGLIALVLIVCWLLGLFAFHISTGLFHILLVIGLIMLILHFVRGRSATI
jgi:hypothetical protein